MTHTVFVWAHWEKKKLGEEYQATLPHQPPRSILLSDSVPVFQENNKVPLLY